MQEIKLVVLIKLCWLKVSVSQSGIFIDPPCENMTCSHFPQISFYDFFVV